MEHLLSVWPKIAERLKATKYILLLTDYDGTLTPIVERPELADMQERTKQVLQSLAQQHRFRIGILSGRALAEIKEKVGISGIVYAGNHGLEIEGPGVNFANPQAEEAKPILRVLYQVLSKNLETIKGVLVEDKGLTLSVHYRMVDESKAEEVKKIIDRYVGVAQAAGQVRITTGKKVYEVRPAVAWDKGKTIKFLMKKYGKGSIKGDMLAMYFGDDVSDEDGFKVIEECENGISVFVGGPNSESAARYFLKSPAEMTEFLALLLKQNQKGSS
ncbi:MAG: trehalose-phosphatase [Chloroflexi bacterium]|nr:trehalose-phosphatase [Chloroflexota bacterium]